MVKGALNLIMKLYSNSESILKQLKELSIVNVNHKDYNQSDILDIKECRE